MKTVEIRRHSIRSNPGVHLNQRGVALARRVGQGLGPFDRVITSTLPRAFETAIAMGFAVDEQNELMNPYGDGVEREAPWPLSCAGYAEAGLRPSMRINSRTCTPNSRTISPVGVPHSS